jgi:hypothetical protein
MTIYFRVFPKNGTAKSAMSWEVMELPPFSTRGFDFFAFF